jgi:AraC family transcriptional regulator
MSNHPEPTTYQNVEYEVEAAPFSHLLLSSKNLGWDNINVLTCHVDRVHDLDSIPQVIAAEDSIIMQLDGLVNLSRYLDGRWKHGHSERGVMSLAPQKMPMKFRWTDEATNLYLHFNPEFLPTLVQQIGRGDPLHLELTEQFAIRDAFIEQIIWALLCELQSNGSGEQLYVDMLTQALGLHLLRTYANIKPVTQPSSSRLTSQQICRVKDYIELHLTENITLPQLASYAGVSTSHFGRWFKASFGAAPHQYVIQRRLERAQQLLKQPDMTIAQAAQQVGFYDQSHLVRHFKRAYGTAPQVSRLKMTDN